MLICDEEQLNNCGPKTASVICNCFVIVIMQEKLEWDLKIEVAFFVIICRRI